VAGICVTATPGPQGLTVCGTTDAAGVLAASSPTPIPPTPTPKAKTYTVTSGDTLSRICTNQVAAMGLEGCIDSIIELNDFSGPDEMIYEGQQLTLPPNTGTPTATTHHTAAPTPTPVVVSTAEPATEPEASTEDDSSASASLTAIDPAGSGEADDATDDPSSDEATADATEAPENTPPTDEEIAASGGTEYTVESGDSLSSICDATVTDMSVDDCVEFVVLLNNLSGADQVAAGDTILIP
jgi:LysM repeat protein